MPAQYIEQVMPNNFIEKYDPIATAKRQRDDAHLLWLPTEILHMVARNCHSGKDFVNLMLTCRQLYTTVAARDSPIWKHWFKKKFDAPDTLTSEMAQSILTGLTSGRKQNVNKVKKRPRPVKIPKYSEYVLDTSPVVSIHFNMRQILELVAGMLVDIPTMSSVTMMLTLNLGAFVNTTKGQSSKTLMYLTNAMHRSGQLNKILHPDCRQLPLKILQLLFLPSAMDPDRRHGETHFFQDSKRIAYGSEYHVACLLTPFSSFPQSSVQIF